MIKTEFYDDFLIYYDKADILEKRNTGIVSPYTICGDPIMDHIAIYDTVHRHEAGFNKALADVHNTRKRKDLVRYPSYQGKLSVLQFHLLHLFHRFTGSGASFQPTFFSDGSRNPKEHGYLNNHVDILAQIMVEANTMTAIKYIAKCGKPMVTSVGNQPPSLKNKEPDKYRLAMQYYFDNYAIPFLQDYCDFTMNRYDRDNKLGIKEAVDYCCKWHKDRGFKQWHFVLTAFVMDTAEYYPYLVDPQSHCYYGANCIKSFDLMFQKEPSDGKIKKKDWNEKCMTELVKARPTSLPYDMEDVCCDVIRYWTEYIPKGYEHLSSDQCVNNSTLKVNGEYKEAAKKRIKEVLGKDY